MKKMGEVQAARLAAMCKEFPFLGRYIPDIAWLDEVPKIKRIDLDVLERCGHTHAWSCGHYGFSRPRWFNTARRYLFIGTGGNEVGEARQADATFVSSAPSIWNLWRPTQKSILHEGEMVIEAVRRLGDPDAIRYVLYIYNEYNRSVEAPSYIKESLRLNSGGLHLTLYKVPAGQTLGSWVEKLAASAEKELTMHIAKLDGV